MSPSACSSCWCYAAPIKRNKKTLLNFHFLLDSLSTLCYNKYRADEFGAIENAAVAHLVERHLAKVEVASSSLVSRSKIKRPVSDRSFYFISRPEARKGVKQNSPVGCFVARVFRPTAPVGRSLAKPGLDERVLRLAPCTRSWQSSKAHKKSTAHRRCFFILIPYAFL